MGQDILDKKPSVKMSIQRSKPTNICHPFCITSDFIKDDFDILPFLKDYLSVHNFKVFARIQSQNWLEDLSITIEKRYVELKLPH